MYKIKSTVGEVKEICVKYLKRRKEVVKKRRVEYIHNIIADKTIFGKPKFKSVRDVVRYMKRTSGTWGTIWSDLNIRGSYWGDNVKNLYTYCKNLPEDREIWLQEDMSFLFQYKGE